MTRAAAGHARRCLDQVQEALTAQGFMADEPAGFCCMCSINGLNDGIPAMTDLAGTGALAAELAALPAADLSPEQAARAEMTR